jgi:hypothetical protein
MSLLGEVQRVLDDDVGAQAVNQVAPPVLIQVVALVEGPAPINANGLQLGHSVVLGAVLHIEHDVLNFLANGVDVVEEIMQLVLGEVLVVDILEVEGVTK